MIRNTDKIKKNIAGKEENTGYQHFLLFQQCFQKPSFSKYLTLYSIDTHFNASTTDSLENIVGKEEIAHNEQFLLFQQCFLLNQIIVPHLSIFLTSYFYLLLISPFPAMFSTQSDNCTPFVHIFDIILLFTAELEEPKIGI